MSFRVVRVSSLILSLPLVAGSTVVAADVPATQPVGAVAPAVVDRLIAENLRLLTGNNEPYAREVGARDLLKLPSPAAWDRLAAVLRNPTDPVAQVAACQAIAGSPERRTVLIEPLFELLRAESNVLRRAAAHALARFKSPGVIERLALLARQPVASAPTARSATVRLGAIDALGAMGDEKAAIAALMTLLDDPSPEIVAAALDRIDDSSDADLMDVQSAQHWWAENKDLDERAWLHRRNEQLRTRIERMSVATAQLTTRLNSTLRASYYATPEADRDKMLLDLLNDPQMEVRGLGIDLIDARIGDRRQVPPEIATRVETLVSDSSPSVRRGAASVLGDLRDKSRVSGLLAALNRETDDHVRAAMVAALGRIGGSAATTAVIAAINDPSLEVSSEAALAAGALAEPGIGSLDVVGAACDALIHRYSTLGKPGEMTPRGAANEATPGALPRDLSATREAFLSAMARIASPRFRPLLIEALKSARTAGVRRAAIRGLAATDDGATAAIIRPLLDDPDASVRASAAESMGKLTSSATEADLSALSGRLDATREPEEAVRSKAWESLRGLLKVRPIERQFEWAERYNRPSDKAVMERYVELLSEIERRLASEPARGPLTTARSTPDGQERLGGPVARFEILERLGEANLALGNRGVAASYFEQAALAGAAAQRQQVEGGTRGNRTNGTTSAPNRSIDAAALTRARRNMLAAVDALLAAHRYDAAVTLIERNRSNSIARDADSLLDYPAIGDRLDREIATVVHKKDSTAAPDLARAVDQLLLAETPFGDGERRALVDGRRKLEALIAPPAAQSGPARTTSSAPADRAGL